MRKVRFLIALLIAVAVASFAQRVDNSPDMNIDAAAKSKTIQSLAKLLRDLYVFPEVGNKLADDITSRLSKKEYDSVTSAKAFAALLTKQLQDISHDKHLRVGYSYEEVPTRKPGGGPSPEQIQAYRSYMVAVNSGFEKAERLPGNIGYIKLNGFMEATIAGETAAAAMGFVANTDALIIDLRDNGGGDPAMVAQLCSYFFEDRVHLNDLYFRPQDSTEQFHTLSYLPGKRYLDKDVYILTSSRTFSAAEEFTYNMQTQKRATIVGETTGGGANPGRAERLSEHFSAFIPTGRAINPITKTNWEGVGVKPDIATTRDKALETAIVTASKKLLEKTQNEMLKDELRENLNKGKT